MNREAWQATVHGVAKVGHNLATEAQPQHLHCSVVQAITTSLPDHYNTRELASGFSSCLPPQPVSTQRPN